MLGFFFFKNHVDSGGLNLGTIRNQMQSKVVRSLQRQMYFGVWISSKDRENDSISHGWEHVVPLENNDTDFWFYYSPTLHYKWCQTNIFYFIFINKFYLFIYLFYNFFIYSILVWGLEELSGMQMKAEDQYSLQIIVWLSVTRKLTLI